MAINHDVVRPLVAVAVGLLLAIYVYRFVTDPEPALQKAQEESIVLASRDILKGYVAPSIEIVVWPIPTTMGPGTSRILTLSGRGNPSPCCRQVAYN